MVQQLAVGNILALDFGARRIGVAIAHSIAQLPRPLVTLTNDVTFLAELQKIITQESVIQLVVGLPRNLAGEDTGQTAEAREFAERVHESLGLPVALQDEALTSHQAEAELKARPHAQGDVDSIAAMYILEDYLREGKTA